MSLCPMHFSHAHSEKRGYVVGQYSRFMAMCLFSLSPKSGELGKAKETFSRQRADLKESI